MKKKLTCLWLVFSISLLHVCPVKAQPVVFNRVPLFEENVRGFITAMAQDAKGYMWFTGTSLYRYDGYRVVTYKHDPNDNKSISSSRLETIYIDRNDIIWLGTFGSGLDRFDPATGIFSHYPNNPSDPSSISHNIVTAITEDNEGNLWVGTHNGLNRLNKKTGKFTRFLKKPNDSGSLSNNQVRAVYRDKKGVIWVGCGSPYNNETPEGEGGLNRFNTKTGKFVRYLHDPDNPNTLLDNKVRAIYEDSRGNFWIGTFGDGLHIMDRRKGTFKRFPNDPSYPEKLSSPIEKGNYHGVSFITEDKSGGIWIGAFLAGLNHFDPKTSKLTRFKVENDKPNALGENTVWNIASSREGVLWISTQSNVYRIDPLRKNIPHIETGGRVHSFHEDSSGVLWIASDSGLIRKDRRSNATRYFLNEPKDPGSISSNLVISVYEDRQGQLWVGTDSGLNLYNKLTNKFTRYQHNAKNNNTLSSNGIISILEDRQGAFWIATDGGLNLMDRRTGSFRHYKYNSADSNSLSSDLVFKILEDRSGNLWFGTWGSGGINLLNRQTGHFKHYLQGRSIMDIFEASDGIIWVGTQSGLYRRNKDTDDFSVFIDPASEIGTSNIAGVVEDEQKNLWIGSQSAIIKLNLRRNETAVYGRKYGVIPNSVYDLTASKTSSGELLFGDGTGYYAFFPRDLTINSMPPQLQITDFKIADISLKPGHSRLPGRIEEIAEIKLKYKEDNFSIEFAGIHFSSLEENRHFYMLEGYDKKWRRAGSEKTAVYFNVPPGEYTFRVKASSSDGIWAEKMLRIIITPPWWHTWWAYALYAVLFTVSISGIIHFRSRSLMKEKRLLEQQVTQRTAEVVNQKEEILIQRDNLKHALDELKATQAQLIQSEKMASLGDLTAGIAHEIQNPLNFVKNFSEVNTELINEFKAELQKPKGERNEQLEQAILNDLSQNLEKISLHGKRADSIVKGMLQHSRSSTGQKESTNINALADEYLRLAYHGLSAKNKSFNATIKTDFDEKIGNINVIPQEIGRVILNLITNAFYAVTEKEKQQAQARPPVRAGTDGVDPFERGFEPIVSVSTSMNPSGSRGADVLISIKDNGNGIPKKILDKIYQPFFTTKPSGQGTGLGLSLSYDIIKAHGGEIKVETKEGEGAEFIIRLPVE